MSTSTETERDCEPRYDGQRHRSSRSCPDDGWHSEAPQYTSTACGFVPNLRNPGAGIGASRQDESLRNARSAQPLHTEDRPGERIMLLAQQTTSLCHDQQMRATGFRKRGASLDCSYHHPKPTKDKTSTAVNGDLGSDLTPPPTPAQQARLRQRPPPGSGVIPPKRRSSLPGRKSCPMPKRPGRRLSSIAEVSMSPQPIPRKPLPISKDSSAPQNGQLERPGDHRVHPSSSNLQSDPLKEELMDQEGWLEPKSSWDSDTDSLCSSNSNLEHGEDERLNRASSASGSEAINGIKKSFFSGISRAFSSNSALIRVGLHDCAKRKRGKSTRNELLTCCEIEGSQCSTYAWDKEAPGKRRYGPNKDGGLSVKQSSRQWKTKLMCGHCGDVDNEL